MSTLQPDTHTGRLDAGDAVLAAAETVTTKPISVRLTLFRKSHDALAKATAALNAAEAKLRAAQEKVAEADVTQDETIDPLAAALVGVGQPRTQPFKGLVDIVPSRMKALGYAIEANALLKLVANVRKRKGLTTAATKAATNSERAAKAVLAALVPVGALEKALSAARTRRDALTQPWETSFSALKRAARAADDDGAGGLYDALFRATAPPKKPRAKKKPATPPTPTPA